MNINPEEILRPIDRAKTDYLGQLGVNPDDFDLGYQPEIPKFRSHAEAYHPGARGVVERFGPMLTKAFAAGDWESPVAKMLARLAGAAGDLVQSGVKDREADIDKGNQSELYRVQQNNEFRRSEVGANRTRYNKLLNERLPTPRQVVERKLAAKAEEAGTTEQARIDVRRKAGLEPAGTPHPRRPPAAKPWSATSFRLFGDADKMAVGELENELKAMRQDYTKAQAFEPPRKDRAGATVGESPAVASARKRITEINSQIHSARKSAILWHLEQVASESAANPVTAKAKLKEIYRAAAALRMADDPEVDAAAEAAGAAIESAVAKTP